jgi:hypothetical protein
MTQGILGGLFTSRQVEHHLQLIREHLLFPDGARLIDRPVTYRGGPQTIFRRPESFWSGVRGSRKASTSGTVEAKNRPNRGKNS